MRLSVNKNHMLKEENKRNGKDNNGTKTVYNSQKETQRKEHTVNNGQKYLEH